MSAPYFAGTAALYISVHGRDIDGSGVRDQDDVYALRQTLIDLGQAQAYWQGGDTADPDTNPEPLLQAQSFGPPNDRPTVNITAPTDGWTVDQGTSVSFTATVDDTEDGVISSGISWNSNIDGALGTGASHTAPLLSVGTHTVTASVTDSAGKSGTASITVTVNPTGGGGNVTLNLTGSAANNGSTWTANVTISITMGDAERATVTGTWSNGATGLGACEIGQGGCTITASGIRKKNGSATFTVGSVGALGFDGETAITVLKP